MSLKSLLAVSAGLLVAFAVHAAAPASVPVAAPAGSTGLCKDGSYSSAAEKKGACRGHKGVQDWYANASTPTTQAAMPAGAAPDVKPAGVASASAKAVAPVAVKAAPGGGPGMVWANTSSKVYHCPTGKWYGKTKTGEYLSEADAKTKGFHAEHGKACAS